MNIVELMDWIWILSGAEQWLKWSANHTATQDKGSCLGIPHDGSLQRYIHRSSKTMNIKEVGSDKDIYESREGRYNEDKE